MVDNNLAVLLTNEEKPAWVIQAENTVARSRTLEQGKRLTPKSRKKCWCGKPLKRGRCRTHAGFTCINCPRPKHTRSYWDRLYRKFNKYVRTVKTSHYTERCPECNRKKSRHKRANKAFDKIQSKVLDGPGLKTWFITLTKPNIVGVEIMSPSIMGADKDLWIEDFHRFRRRKIWKETFSGGYWFYEVTTHSPGDKVFSKDGKYIRTVQENELNGHLHIVANGDRWIDMKGIAKAWDGRVDFKKPRYPSDVKNYLKGYLTKCETKGINMRPFGDIHQSPCRERGDNGGMSLRSVGVELP